MKKYLLGLTLLLTPLLVLASTEIIKGKNDTEFEISTIQKSGNRVLEQIDYMPIHLNELTGYDAAKTDKENKVTKGYLTFIFKAKNSEKGRLDIEYVYQNAYGENKKYYKDAGSLTIDPQLFKSKEEKIVYNKYIDNTNFIIKVKKK